MAYVPAEQSSSVERRGVMHPVHCEQISLSELGRFNQPSTTSNKSSIPQSSTVTTFPAKSSDSADAAF